MTAPEEPPVTEMSDPGQGRQFVCWRYAVRGDVPEPVIEEMRRAHQAQMQLIETELEHEQAVAAIWASVPEYASASERLQNASSSVRRLAAQARKERLAAASGRAQPETMDQLRLARGELAQAKDRLNRIREEAGPALGPQFAAALDTHRASVRALYRQAVGRGLYRDSYSEVLARHRQAVTRVREARREGRAASLVREARRAGGAATLWARPWDGTGTVTAQLARRADEPARSPGVIAAPDGKYRNQALLQPWILPAEWEMMPGRARRPLQAGTLRLRIGSSVISEFAELMDLHGRGFAAEAERWLSAYPVPDDAQRVLLVLAAHADEVARAASSGARTGARASGYEGMRRKALRAQVKLPPDRLAAALEILAEKGRLAAAGRSWALRGVTAADWVTIPVTVHRMLPPDADITSIEVTRTRTGTRYRAHVLVSASVPVPAARRAGPRVALCAGWRLLPDNSIRTAVIAGAPPPPPQLAAAGIVRDRGSWAEVVAPARWRELERRISNTHARRMRGLAAMREWLAGWLAEHREPAALLDPDGALSPDGAPPSEVADLYAAAALRLRQAAPPGCEEPAGRLWAWRLHNRRLHNWEASEREQLIARRNDSWKNVAAWVTGAAGAVIMAGFQADGLAGEDDSREQREAWACQRLAAPFTLRENVTIAARLRGVPVELANSPAPAVHHTCGTPLGNGARPVVIAAWCPSCHVVVDRDANALDALLTRVPPVSG